MITEFRCQFCKCDRYATIQSIPHAVNGTNPALQETVFSPALAA